MAAPTFLKRSEAAAYAREQGWVAFRTHHTNDDTWRATYEPGENPAQAVAEYYSEFCTHGEVAWVGGATGDEDPHKVGVLVFRVPLDAVAQVGAVELDHTLSRVWVKGGNGEHAVAYLAEPHDAARWDVFTPKVATPASLPAQAALKQHGNIIGGNGGLDPNAPVKAKVVVSRSSAESPTKRVWAIADAMVGATRPQVVAACVAEGINKNTAGTQYHHWTKHKQAQG